MLGQSSIILKSFSLSLVGCRLPLVFYRLNFASTTICTRSYHHTKSINERIGPRIFQSEQRNGFIRRRTFHTSPRNEIHPAIILLIKPVAKMASMITGRSFRQWWKRLPVEQRQHYKTKFLKNRSVLAIAVSLLGLGATVHYFTHIQETPVTNRKRYVGLTHQQFLKIAQFECDMQYEALSNDIVPTTHPAYARVLRIVQNIVNSNQDLKLMQEQTWTVIVVNSPDKNAFVLPTGHIFVYTGLLDIATTDSQLGFVLGHEIAHAILSHGAEQVSFAAALDVIIIIAMGAIWAIMPTDGIAIVAEWFYNKVMQIMLHLPYSRMLEEEADFVGLQLIAKACFDVRESSTFWRTMSVDSELNDNYEAPQWLSTHPNHENRASTLDNLIPDAIDLRKKCNCPALPNWDYNGNLKHLQELLTEKQKLDLARKERILTMNENKLKLNLDN